VGERDQLVPGARQLNFPPDDAALDEALCLLYR